MMISRYMQLASVRYGAMAGAACIITIMLFFMMHSLIEYGANAALEEVEPNKVIEFIRIKKPAETAIEDKELPQKTLEEAPPPPSVDMPTTSSASGIAMSFDSMDIKPPSPELSLADLQATGSASSGLVPLVRVQPMYPPSAANQRIEGWVELEFTISVNGKVKRPRVLRSFPSDIFNQSALQAIKKWKYRPRVEDGEKVETHGVSVRLKFELDNM